MLRVLESSTEDRENSVGGGTSPERSPRENDLAYDEDESVDMNRVRKARSSSSQALRVACSGIIAFGFFSSVLESSKKGRDGSTVVTQSSGND